MAEAKRRRVKKVVKMQGSNTAGPFYFLGLIGAAVFYIKEAGGFGEVVVALLKATVWPAYFVYELLRHVSL